MYKNKKISLVIPAYNEQKLIEPTLLSVPKTIDIIYVIDDASTDKMPFIIKGLAKKDKRIQYIRHKRNYGPGQGIMTGYKHSVKDGYDIAVVIGGDNQMDLADMPNFLEPLTKGEADYTKGNRFLLSGNAFKDMPMQRFIGNSILTFMTKMASGYWKIFDTQDGYTAITKEAIERVDWSTALQGYGYPSDFLVLFNVHNIRVKDVPRRAIYLKGERQSQINILRYIIKVGPRLVKRFFWRLIMKYFFQEFHPLIFFYLLSFFLIPLGFAMGVWIAYNAFIGPVSGNQAILTALFLITGIQFLLFAMLFDMQQNQ